VLTERCLLGVTARGTTSENEHRTIEHRTIESRHFARGWISFGQNFT